MHDAILIHTHNLNCKDTELVRGTKIVFPGEDGKINSAISWSEGVRASHIRELAYSYLHSLA